MSFVSSLDGAAPAPAGGGVGVAGRTGAALGGIFADVSGVLAFFGGMMAVTRVGCFSSKRVGGWMR